MFSFLLIRYPFFICNTGTPTIPVLPSCGFGIGEEQLTKMTRDHDFSALQNYGEVGKPFELFFVDVYLFLR